VAVAIHAPDWDEEAIEEAEYRARALEPFDRDAASDLRAMAAAARATLHGTEVVAVREPYDPTRIYARACKFYPGWTPATIDQMHFPLFFAMIREASAINEEEKAEYDRARRQHEPSVSPEQAMGLFPVAEKYEGETVPL
jgi:hypothetical protein